MSPLSAADSDSMNQENQHQRCALNSTFSILAAAARTPGSVQCDGRRGTNVKCSPITRAPEYMSCHYCCKHLVNPDAPVTYTVGNRLPMMRKSGRHCTDRAQQGERETTLG